MSTLTDHDLPPRRNTMTLRFRAFVNVHVMRQGRRASLRTPPEIGLSPESRSAPVILLAPAAASLTIASIENTDSVEAFVTPPNNRVAEPISSLLVCTTTTLQQLLDSYDAPTDAMTSINTTTSIFFILGFSPELVAH